MDDIIVDGKTIEECLQKLEKVLRRLQENGFRLKPQKCKFLQRFLTYLGHVIGEYGKEVDPKKTIAIQNYPKPKNVAENFFSSIRL